MSWWNMQGLPRITQQLVSANTNDQFNTSGKLYNNKR